MALALCGGLIKGFSGKKISRDVDGLKDSVFVNVIRMVLCAAIGALLVLFGPGAVALRLTPEAFLISLFSAVCMSVFCVAWMCAYRSEAYMFLSVFTMLGSIVTSFLGLFVYGEPIGILDFCGMLLLLLAVFVMSKYNKEVKGKKRFTKEELLILITGALGACLSDFSQKIFVKQTGGEASVFNFYTYAIGGVLLGVILALLFLLKRDKPVSPSLLSRGNFLGYIGISAFLYLNSICKTLAVGTGLTVTEIYPVLNGSNLIASAILANILFKEKITKKSVIGMALAFVGVVLINLF